MMRIEIHIERKILKLKEKIANKIDEEIYKEIQKSQHFQNKKERRIARLDGNEGYYIGVMSRVIRCTDYLLHRYKRDVLNQSIQIEQLSEVINLNKCIFCS